MLLSFLLYFRPKQRKNSTEYMALCGQGQGRPSKIGDYRQFNPSQDEIAEQLGVPENNRNRHLSEQRIWSDKDNDNQRGALVRGERCG